MLFYDKYVFELKPVYIKLSTNYKDTQLFVNDNLACTADKNNFTQEVGPYVPGMYKIKAKLNGKYADLEKSVDVDLVKVLASSKDDKKTYTTSVYLDGRQISVSCSYEDAKLFANGKDTGLTIQDAKNFGPLPLDGTVKLYAQKEFPWGTVKGEELAVKSSYVSLKLSGLDDSSKSAVMDTLNSYNKNYINAFNTRDISKLTDLTDKQRIELKNNINNFIEFKEMFTGSFKKASYDLDSMNVFKQDGKYYVRAVAQMQLSSAVYSEGTPAPTLSSDTVVYSYTLLYDEVTKKWLVDSEYRGGYFSGNSTKEFTY
jgi:uncharacterized membrane protein YvbJ